MPGKRIVRKKVRRSGSKVNKALKRYVKSTLTRGLETKTHNYEYSVGISATATVVDLTAISQSMTGTGRIGQEIHPKNIELIYNLYTASADSTNTFRILIFQWHPNNNIDLPQSPEIFDLITTGVGWECYAPFNFDKRKMFTVLYDQIHVGVTGNDSAVGHYRKKRIGPFKPVQYNYSQDDGTNHVYLYYISDSTGAPHPSMNMMIRMKYKDA